MVPRIETDKLKPHRFEKAVKSVERFQNDTVSLDVLTTKKHQFGNGYVFWRESGWLAKSAHYTRNLSKLSE